MFSKVDSIDVTVLKTYEVSNTVIVEMEILIDGDSLLVTDIIDYDDSKKIVSIRAYLG